MIAEASPKSRSKSWVVVVTHGTQPFSKFAVVGTRSSAIALLDIARSRGYRNPRVMSYRDYCTALDDYLLERYERNMNLKFDYMATIYGPGVAEKMRSTWRAQTHPSAVPD